MDISLQTSIDLPFRQWLPNDGKVFDAPFALDTETELVDEEYSWLTPAFVLGAVCDGKKGFFLTRETMEPFLRAHDTSLIVMHNAPFDLAVLQVLCPTLDIYAWVDQNRVLDTLLLHRLYILATEGHPAMGKEKSNLEVCLKNYLDIDLSKVLLDDEKLPVRTSYGQWLHKPFGEIKPIYLEYVAKDALGTFLLYERLNGLLYDAMVANAEVFGYIDDGWLATQITQWGLQTHHIQLKAAVVLKKIQANGLHVDVARREELDLQFQKVEAEQLALLQNDGYLPQGKGSITALQKIFEDLQRNYPEVAFPLTPTQMFSTSADALAELDLDIPFLDALGRYKTVKKLRSTYLNKMGKPVLHPSFNVLTAGGRTSSFGDINAQNLPRDDRVRSCFIPSPNHLFLAADYAAVEMATLAQAVISQFQQHSVMADKINAGEDLHRSVASKVLNVPEAEITSTDRQKAKAINFGKPGGMGVNRLKAYAKVSFGVVLSDAEAEQFNDAWMSLFPEMEAFLFEDSQEGEKAAEIFHLTPTTFFEQTGDNAYLEAATPLGRANMPEPILGWMCLKTLATEIPETRTSRSYKPQEIDYFWRRMQEHLETLPEEFHAEILARSPSPDLRQKVRNFLDRASVFTLTGRLRAKAGYCARHNTLFQGLAADGAKLALWRLWRSGYRIVNFIHDEVLIEVPVADNLQTHAKNIRQVMIAAMQEVTPNLNITVECAAMDRWYKSAKPTYDGQGNLIPWQPLQKSEEPQTLISTDKQPIAITFPPVSPISPSEGIPPAETVL